MTNVSLLTFLPLLHKPGHQIIWYAPSISICGSMSRRRINRSIYMEWELADGTGFFLLLGLRLESILMAMKTGGLGWAIFSLSQGSIDKGYLFQYLLHLAFSSFLRLCGNSEGFDMWRARRRVVRVSHALKQQCQVPPQRWMFEWGQWQRPWPFLWWDRLTSFIFYFWS